MTSSRMAIYALLLMASIPGLGFQSVAEAGDQSDGAAAVKLADLRGTWSGSFQSKHDNVAPFTVTVVIEPDSHGQLMGKASHDSPCLSDVDLQVSINGSRIYLAGSDPEGNSVTFRGTIDRSRTLLSLHYIVNGSAGGRCESDQGDGNLGKR